jgi:hypothetical protein
MSPAEAFLALSGIVLMALAFGPHGAKRCAATLAANWISCQSFVVFSQQATPWPWFWTIDLLSAIAVTISPVSNWQRALAYLYMFQLGIHAGFAITGGDALRYLYGLDALLMLQMLVVITWTTGHGLLRLCDAHHWRPAVVYSLLSRTAQ